MRIDKTQYERLYWLKSHFYPLILIEMDFYDWWDIKIFQNSVRMITISFHPKNVYVPLLANYFLHKIQTFILQLPKEVRKEVKKDEG